MRKIFSGVLITIISLIAISCEKSGSEVDITELTLTLNKLKILDDNTDAALVTVLNQDNADVTALVDLYLDDKKLTSSNIRSDQAGTFNVHAQYKEISSNLVQIEVIEDVGLMYNKTLLIEQFTGTWCGYCPRAIDFIHNILVTDPYVGHIAYHLSDPLTFTYNGSLFQYFGFTGVPTVLVDRDLIWNGLASEISLLHKPVRTGISLSVSGTESQVNINVKAHFGVNYNDNLNLTVYLVEDNLVHDQTNYYNDDPSSVYYQAGEIMTGFIHRNTMIATVTDMFGNSIPADGIDIDKVYEVNFQVTSPQVTNLNNLKVVAFVSYASGTEQDKVINSLVCSFDSVSESTPIVD